MSRFNDHVDSLIRVLTFELEKVHCVFFFYLCLRVCKRKANFSWETETLPDQVLISNEFQKNCHSFFRWKGVSTTIWYPRQLNEMIMKFNFYVLAQGSLCLLGSDTAKFPSIFPYWKRKAMSWLLMKSCTFCFRKTSSNNHLSGYRMNLQFGNEVGYILRCTCMSIYWEKMQLLYGQSSTWWLMCIL